MKKEQETCYCHEREINPAMAELLKDIPEGYCGICDSCGKPGHTRAHPSLPTTVSLCDEHWDTLYKHPPITLDQIVAVAIFIILGIVIILAI